MQPAHRGFGRGNRLRRGLPSGLRIACATPAEPAFEPPVGAAQC